MVKRIKTYEVQILPKEVECSKLSERNAETYHTAAYYSEPLLKKIVSEFETALKKEAGLDKIVKKYKDTHTRMVGDGKRSKCVILPIKKIFEKATIEIV